MTIDEIRGFPTSYDDLNHGGKCHESLLRSFQVMEKAKEWLEAGAPPSVVLEMMRACYPERTSQESK
jgi:hypothetical protein